MLVVNTVFLISVICSAANIVISTDTSASSVSSTKLKRGIVDLGPDDNQEQFREVQSTPRISSLQDINSRALSHYRNAKASDTQRVSYANPNQRSVSHAYGRVPKPQFSYSSSPILQNESHQNNLLAPYFNLLNNPNTYKAAINAGQSPDLSKSIVSQSVQKLQEAYSPSYNAFHSDKPIDLSKSFTSIEYPSYSSINKIISQDFQGGVSSPTTQVPEYKSSYSLPKATEYAHIYAASFPMMSSTTPLFQPLNKAKQSFKQNDAATVNVNDKKLSLPIIQLQSDSGLPSAFPTFESEPFLLTSNYPFESGFEFNFEDAPKANVALQPQKASPFVSPLSSFQGQVVPIQTASSTPQFPQYKGASIHIYPVTNNIPKVQGNYESFYNQPHLHFGNEHAGQPVNPQQNVIPSSISTEDIIEDVEIINKKNPGPHPNHMNDDDEDEKDMRYKNPMKENEYSSEEDDVEYEPGKHFKESKTESDFKPSSFPFKEYDETFGKYTEQTDDEDSEDKPYSGYKNSSSEDDEEKEDLSSEYNSEYAESPKSHGSYEEEDEEQEESRKYEKHRETDEDSHEVEPKRPKYHKTGFEREFEESYRKELPKQRYVHVKEVPDIDSNNNPKPFISRTRVNHKRTKESSARDSRKNRKVPKTGHKDSAAHSTDLLAGKASRVVYEEFYGYKNPKTGKYSKRTKAEPAVEKYSPAKKLTAQEEGTYLRAAKYYKFKSPKTDGEFVSKNKYPHSYSSANDWKSSKISTGERVPESNARQLANPGDRASLYRPSAVNGQVRSLTNAEIFRDLTGI